MIKRFDMGKAPKRQALRPLMWALCFPALKKHNLKLEKINLGGIKPPYILLQNHNAFLDFKVLTKAVYPYPTNYVIAIDGFIKREWLLRRVGGICKRKYTNDLRLVKNIKKVINNGDIIVIYPEARYSLCGIESYIPESIAKLVKHLKVPLVSLISHGHHINSPFYNSHPRGIKYIESTMKCLVKPDELENISSSEIYDRIKNEFKYDDYKWQKENNVIVPTDNRAIGLEKVLYKCPHCLTEYKMTSLNNTLQCSNCGATWNVSPISELESDNPIFTHIPDWYKWEVEEVKKEIIDGSYFFKDKVRIRSLPNSKGFIDLGIGELVHDMEGFHLTKDDLKLTLPSKENYAVHIEYNYLFKYGDCIDLNTLNDTYYCYPQRSDFSVTKISIATEVMYHYYMDKLKESKQ